MLLALVLQLHRLWREVGVHRWHDEAALLVRACDLSEGWPRSPVGPSSLSLVLRLDCLRASGCDSAVSPSDFLCVLCWLGLMQWRWQLGTALEDPAVNEPSTLQVDACHLLPLTKDHSSWTPPVKGRYPLEVHSIGAWRLWPTRSQAGKTRACVVWTSERPEA